MKFSSLGARAIPVCLALGIFANHAFAQKPSTEVSVFGTLPSGEMVRQFTLKNGTGMQVKVIELGATLTEISAPDKNGKFANVVLSTDSLESYSKGFPAAAVMGRYGGRIGGARFQLDGKLVQVTKNAGENHIHGGQMHFGKRLWREAMSKNKDAGSVTLEIISVDGEEGFPGTLKATVTYALTSSGALKIDYSATSDKTTVINLTNHAYFNLSGAGGDILGHYLQIESDETAAVNRSMIPTGKLVSVDRTPLDFRQPRLIGERIAELYGAQEGTFTGYDHTYALRGQNGTLRLAAKVTEPNSGRVMECYTTEPAVQFFTANGMNNNPFPKHGGFCLETQHYPDSPNRPEFPSTVLRPGVAWTSSTVFQFRTTDVKP